LALISQIGLLFFFKLLYLQLVHYTLKNLWFFTILREDRTFYVAGLVALVVFKLNEQLSNFLFKDALFFVAFIFSLLQLFDPLDSKWLMQVRDIIDNTEI